MAESHSYDFDPSSVEAEILGKLPPSPIGVIRRYSFTAPSSSERSSFLAWIPAQDLSEEQKQRNGLSLRVYDQLQKALPGDEAKQGKTLSAESMIRLWEGIVNQHPQFEFLPDDVYSFTEARLLDWLTLRTEGNPEHSLDRRANSFNYVTDGIIAYHRNLLRSIGAAVEMVHAFADAPEENQPRPFTLHEDVRYFDEEADTPPQRAEARSFLDQLGKLATHPGESSVVELSADQVREAFNQYTEGISLDPAIEHKPIKLIHVLGALRRWRTGLKMVPETGITPELERARASYNALWRGVTEALGRTPKAP